MNNPQIGLPIDFYIEASEDGNNSICLNSLITKIALRQILIALGLGKEFDGREVFVSLLSCQIKIIVSFCIIISESN